MKINEGRQNASLIYFQGLRRERVKRAGDSDQA